MNRSRLARAAFDALVVSFVLGTTIAPPDPVTQLLYVAPTFAAALVVLYRYGHQSPEQWWRRYAAFAGGLLAAALAWRVVAFAVPLGSGGAPEARTAVLLAGVALGAWLAYFGGLERLRNGRAEA